MRPPIPCWAAKTLGFVTGGIGGAGAGIGLGAGLVAAGAVTGGAVPLAIMAIGGVTAALLGAPTAAAALGCYEDG